MDKDSYYLFKFINTAKNIKGRKKLQKLMYILKHLGCPIEARFFMHHYGPYSSDLALEIDLLVEDERLKEEIMTVGPGLEEYKYSLTKRGKAYLNFIESLGVDDETKGNVSTWADLFSKLYSKYKVFELELASTILYWTKSGHELRESIKITSQQKNVSPATENFKSAIKLIKSIIPASES